MRKVIASAFILLFLFSCSIKEKNPYLNSEIPKINRNWSHQEYSKAFEVIQSNKVPIPVMKNRFGKEVFLRITSKSNFDIYRDTRKPFKSRYTEFSKFYQFINKFLFLYGDKIEKGEELKEELARLYCFGIYTNEFVIELLNNSKFRNFSNTPYEERMKSLKLITEGNIECFNTAVHLLYAKDFSAKEYSLLIKAMCDTLPSIKTVFPPQYSERLRKDLKKHLSRFVNKDKKRIQSMINILKEA